MLRSALIGFVALGVMAGAVAAQGKMDCGKAYKGFWDKLEREKYAKISPEQLAGVSRMALRAYDACQAALRFTMRLVAVARRDRDLMPLGMSSGLLQPCSVATQRICVEPVERS